MAKNKNKNIIKKVICDGENGARIRILEELFNDFHRNKFQVYWINFVRGVFFGFGVLIGGTVVVALVIWILSHFVTIPLIGEYIRQIIEVIEAK